MLWAATASHANRRPLQMLTAAFVTLENELSRPCTYAPYLHGLPSQASFSKEGAAKTCVNPAVVSAEAMG
jgi:hypothetical protein